MKRLFNKKQRIALAMASNWKCSICGEQLQNGWHSDHKIPFSRGGKTDVINGQATCPTCNLKKGNKMNKIKLRTWQQEALDLCSNEFSNGKKLFLTHATPGGGKTIHGLSVFNSSGHTHLVILAPSTTLVKQWQEEAKKLYGVELKTSMLYSGQSDFEQYQGIVMTYQGMNECAEELRIFCSNNDTLVIADEIHHVADGQAWGDSFRHSFEPATNILALTGTPWASNGKSIAFVSYGSDGYALPDFPYNKVRAIVDNVCRATEFHGMEARDLTFIDNESGAILGTFNTIQDAIDNDIRGAYTKTLHSIKHFKQLFIEADRELSNIRESVADAGGLIVAPSIRAAKEFKDELFMLTGQDYRIVHSKTDKPHESIKDFRKSNERWLISVDMVTEGVDIKRLQVCVFMSTKNTELFLRQVIGRIERRRNEFSQTDRYGYFYYTKTPDVDELVAQFESENKAGLSLVEEQDDTEKDGASGMEKFDDTITLDDVKTELSSLTARGFTFPMDVVRAAMERKRRSGTWLDDAPLYLVCKIIMEEQGHKKDDEATAYQDENYDAPIEVKSARLRKLISSLVNKKMFARYGRQASGEEISRAHKVINNRVGINKTDNSTSIELLESKLEYITNTRGETWV